MRGALHLEMSDLCLGGGRGPQVWLGRQWGAGGRCLCPGCEPPSPPLPTGHPRAFVGVLDPGLLGVLSTPFHLGSVHLLGLGHTVGSLRVPMEGFPGWGPGLWRAWGCRHLPRTPPPRPGQSPGLPLLCSLRPLSASLDPGCAPGPCPPQHPECRCPGFAIARGPRVPLPGSQSPQASPTRARVTPE